MTEKIVTSGKATASLVLGLLALFCCVSFITGPLAIVFGLLGLSDISRSQGQKAGNGRAIAGIATGGVGTVFSTGIMIALLLPAVQVARDAARRMECANHLRQIGIGLHNYHAALGSVPPAVIYDDEGNPMHSWRGLLSPYMEMGMMGGASQYDFSEPWDGPNNSGMAQAMPPVFKCAGDAESGPSSTSYFVVQGPGFLFDGDRSQSFSEVTDGVSNTIALVEAPGLNVEWTEPRDLTFDEFLALLQDSEGLSHFTGVNVLLADGKAVFIDRDIDPEQLRAMFTIAGGETVEIEQTY